MRQLGVASVFVYAQRAFYLFLSREETRSHHDSKKTPTNYSRLCSVIREIILFGEFHNESWFCLAYIIMWRSLTISL